MPGSTLPGLTPAFDFDPHEPLTRAGNKVTPEQGTVENVVQTTSTPDTSAMLQ